jgi:lysophospholipase L1-like esterase
VKSLRSRRSPFARHPLATLTALNLAAVLALLAGSEALLRRSPPAPPTPLAPQRFVRLKELRPLRDFWLTPSDEYLQGTDSLSKKPYRVRTDADGFLLPSRRHERPDLSIAFLGGSTTECLYVDEENRPPHRAALLLEERTRLRVNAYNGGVSGAHTLDLLNVLVNKVMPLRPDVVVLSEALNDLGTQLLLGGYWNRNPSRSPLVAAPASEPPSVRVALRTLKDAFFPLTYARARSAVDGLRARPPEALAAPDEFAEARGRRITIRPALRTEFAANLEAFVALCRSRGIEPVLMTQASRLTEAPDALVRRAVEAAYRDTGIGYAEFSEEYGRFNDTIRRVGRAQHAVVIDLAASIPASRAFMYDGAHYNDAGARAAAEAIAAGLEPVVAKLGTRHPKAR